MKINFQIRSWCQTGIPGAGKEGALIDVNWPPVDVRQAEFDLTLPGLVSPAQLAQLIKIGEKGFFQFHA
jgi:hypothetical protein